MDGEGLSLGTRFLSTTEEKSEYDVFLSYTRRERDAGRFFPQQLHDVLTQNGIKSYKYGEDLEEGEEIAPAVDEAIEASRIFVVILSRDYASSASCLSELVEILEQNKLNGKPVIPLFYGVPPSWVRHQKESYREALVEHESRYGSDQVGQWKAALGEVASIRGGATAVNQGEADFISEVVQEIGTMLRVQKAPTVPKASTDKYFKWAEVIGTLMVGLLALTPSLFLLATGAAKKLPINIVIIFVSVNVTMYLVAVVRYLYSKIRKDTA